MRYRVRNFFIIFAVLLVCYLLQYSAFIRIPVINCSPNLMLIATFAFAYIRNKNAGMLVGFFAGLFIDVFYCQVIGYNALVLLVIGFVCGSLKKVYYTNSLFMQILILSVCDIVNSFVYFFFWFVMQANFNLGYYLIHNILPEFCFTLLAGIVLIRPLSFIINKMYAYRAGGEADIV